MCIVLLLLKIYLSLCCLLPLIVLVSLMLLDPLTTPAKSSEFIGPYQLITKALGLALDI